MFRQHHVGGLSRQDIAAQGRHDRELLAHVWGGCGCLAKVQASALEGLKDSFVTQFGQLRAAVSQRSILLPALFVFLWQVMHHEIWKYCQSTSRLQAILLPALFVFLWQVHYAIWKYCQSTSRLQAILLPALFVFLWQVHFAIWKYCQSTSRVQAILLPALFVFLWQVMHYEIWRYCQSTSRVQA